ncbi:MAG: hypothetical protein KGJ53_01075 [Alphaproteobacteria bacterium]|nr:hypothetical protein [Alphaproteobacteria bacterium]
MISSPITDIMLESTTRNDRPFIGLSVRAGAWIVVPRARRMSCDGLAIYNPQRLKGLLAKALVQHGLWSPPTVYLRDDVVSEIEAVLADCLNHKSVSCAFYFRSPGLFSKTIILALDGNGHAVAYAKLGSTAESNKAVTHEGDVLERLARVPSLAGRIPHVIARTAWRNFPMLLLSVGPSRRPPRAFGAAHHDFLRHLKIATLDRMPLVNSLMWKTISARHSAVENSLEPSWANRYKWALTEVGERVGRGALELNLAHRDFVPWNMRRGEDNTLFVFDWELAQKQCTPGWDFFHYHLAGRLLRAIRIGRSDVVQLLQNAECRGIVPADGYFLAYLVDVGLFLHDRLLRSPATQENGFLKLVESAIESFRRGKERKPAVPAAALARGISG